MLVLRFSDALPFREVGVDLFLVSQVKRERAVHLFERQCRIRIDHTLGRHPLAKQIRERIKRNSRPPHKVLAFDEPNVIYRHRLPQMPQIYRHAVKPRNASAQAGNQTGLCMDIFVRRRCGPFHAKTGCAARRVRK